LAGAHVLAFFEERAEIKGKLSLFFQFVLAARIF